jgi:hypothetical protein
LERKKRVNGIQKIASKFWVWLEKSPDHANDGYQLQISSLIEYLLISTSLGYKAVLLAAGSDRIPTWPMLKTGLHREVREKVSYW